MNILNFWFSKTIYNGYDNKGDAIEISTNAQKFIKKKVDTHDVTHLILEASWWLQKLNIYAMFRCSFPKIQFRTQIAKTQIKNWLKWWSFYEIVMNSSAPFKFNPKFLARIILKWAYRPIVLMLVLSIWLEISFA